MLKKLGRILAHPATWIPGSIGVLIVIVLIALPYGIRYGIQRGLTDAGARQVQVADVDFNPFIGQLAVRGLQVRVDGKRTLVLSQAGVRLALLPLFHRQVVLDDLSLRDGSFTVERTADGHWRFLGLAGNAPPATPDKTSAKASAWGFVLRHAEVLNSQVRYTSAEMSGTAHIDRGELALVPPAGTRNGPAAGDLRVRLNGRLRIEHAKPGVTAASRVDADITATPPTDKNGVWRLSGNGQLHDIGVEWPDGKLRVAAAQRVNVEGLSVTDAGRIAIAALGIDGLRVAQPTMPEAAPAALSVGQLRITEIHLVPGQTLDIAGISMRGLHVVARHVTPQRWYGFASLQELTRAFATPAAQAKPGLAVHIGRIATADPGLIELSDATVQPAFRARIALEHARLTGLDTGTPPAGPAQLALAARIGKYATAEVDGRFDAFSPKITASLEAKLREIEMPALSPYTVKMLGYRVVSGQLNGDLRLRITHGRLEGRNKLALENLSVTPQSDAAAEKLKAQLTMPLDSALAMLRDKNNNVNLDMDVSGNVDDPKFSLTDAINQALTKALRTASVSYLKYFFQPYGSLIVVAELADKALQLRLDPVPFPPGAATPAPATQDYLEKVGKLLQERTDLRLKLCGMAVPGDKLSGDAARDLATKRAETIKDYFVSKYGIASDRLFLCEPALDQDKEALPRVDLTL